MSHHHHCPIHDHNQNCTCCQHEHHSCTCPQHSHESGHHDQCDFAHKLLDMADEAWMEVLKEKIKEQVIATSGSKLDKLAKIVAESNNARWQQKLELLDIAHNFADKVRAFFSQKK
jgi:hypothetical protein